MLLIGVEDDGAVTGCRRVDQKHLNDIERTGDVYCSEARYEAKNVPIINRDGHEDFIVAIWVKYRPDKVVETNEGAAFLRRGSSRKKLKADEIRELQNAKGQVEIEREIVPLRYPDDFKNVFLSTVSLYSSRSSSDSRTTHGYGNSGTTTSWEDQ